MQKLIIVLLLFIVYQGFAQKVGINNTDPQTSLDVNGKLRIRSFGVSATAPNTTLPNGQYGYYSLYGSPGSDFSITMPTGVKGTFIIIENTTNFDATIVGLCMIKPGKSRLLLHGDTGWILANDSESQLEKITEGGYTGWRLWGSNPNNYGDIGFNAVDLSYNDISSTTVGAIGNYSIAMGFGTTASGSTSTAMGASSTASGNVSIAMGAFTTASGTNSTALGSGSNATGETSLAANYSLASGILAASFNTAQAHGEQSFSCGNSYVFATGKYAAAIAGGGAFGRNTSAFGEGTHAISFSSTALGRYNISNFSYDSLNWVATEPVLSIGNGTSDIARSDAMTVYKNGTLELQNHTTIPDNSSNKFFVLNNRPYFGNNVLSSSQLEKITEGGNTGWRLFGRNSNNYGDIGVDAIDFSTSNSSSSTRGATANNSTAFGWGTTASGDGACAMGVETIASGDISITFGHYSEATGDNSTAMGESTDAIGKNSSALGSFTISKAYSSVALGRFNDEIASSNSTDWVDTDPLFLIGNGSSTERKNAMTVYKNGNTDLNGFVRLGEITNGAPRIKTKKMVIASGPNVDSYQNYAFGSGITDEKVLGIEVLLNYSSTYKIPPGYLNTDGYQYDAQVQYNGVTILLKSGNSANIGQKPITILVTYEE